MHPANVGITQAQQQVHTAPLLREAEAGLPKVRGTICAPQRAGHRFAYAGGYSDRDGHHVRAAVFAADGEARGYEFTAPMWRRLMSDPFIKVKVDLVEIAKAEKGSGQLSENDILKARMSELEAKNIELLEKVSKLAASAQAPIEGLTPAAADETEPGEDVPAAGDPAAEAAKLTPTAPAKSKGKGKKGAAKSE